MRDIFDIYGGKWWRFDRYEIRDGYIQPAQGANLESYDPWAVYRASWISDPESEAPLPKRRRQPPPYVSLFNLLDNLRFGAGSSSNRFVPTKESEILILEWCKENGLLGILAQQTLRVVICSQWEDDPPVYPFFTEQYQYIRTNGRWEAATTGWAYHHTDEKSAPFLPDEEMLRIGLKPQVLLQKSVTNTELVQEPLTDTWGKFFPAIPAERKEQFNYPLPLSSEWWPLYAEPIDRFIDGAIDFRDAIESLITYQRGIDDDGYGRIDFRWGMAALNALISSTGPSLIWQQEDKSFRQQWVAPSLLASLAVMASLDLSVGKKKVIRCEACNQYFVSEAYQASYCSITCRNTAAKRRQRKKQSQKGEQ